MVDALAGAIPRETAINLNHCVNYISALFPLRTKYQHP